VTRKVASSLEDISEGDPGTTHNTEDCFMNVRTTTFGLAAVTAGFAAILASMPATATAPAPDTQTRSVTVRYHDSDLNSTTGADKLLERIGGAAYRACSIQGALLYDYESRGFRTCRQNAIERAVEQVDRSKLTAAYNHRYPKNALRAAANLEPQGPLAVRLVPVPG
jgi:UrcA family protein